MIISNMKMTLLSMLIFSGLSIFSMDDYGREPIEPESYMDISEEESMLEELLNVRAEELKQAGLIWYRDLCRAIKNRNKQLVQNLLNDNQYQRSFAVTNIINKIDENGDTPVTLAIKVENPKILKYLISIGRVHLGDKQRHTYLSFASSHIFSNEKAKLKIIALLRNGIPLEKKINRTYLENKYLELQKLQQKLW